MKKMRRMATVVVMALVLGASVKGLADDAWAVNRFFGGSLDGAASISLIQTAPNQRADSRFNGGSYDGYACFEELGLQLPPMKSMIIIR